MKRKQKIFLVISAVLFLTDLGLVGVNFRSARATMTETINERAANLRERFTIALYTTELKLTEIATFISENETIRRQLIDGMAAVAANEPQNGGPIAERVRRELMGIMGARWQQLQLRYLLRQFNFYAGPRMTALLRVQAPLAFGDHARPDSLVAAAMRSDQVQTGFDVDILSPGIRAVLPIDGGPIAAEPLGAIEVGSSLDMMLIPVCPSSQCGISVLLPQDSVRRVMNAATIDTYFTPDRRIGAFFVEATSNPAMTRALLTPSQPPAAPQLIQCLGHWYAVTAFPLSDGTGKMAPTNAVPATVLAWQDADGTVQKFRDDQMVSVGFATGAFLLGELLIWQLLTLVIRHLEHQVERRTAEIAELLTRVQTMAKRDFLTELFNRRAFTERLNEEIGRAKRHNMPFSLVILDIDHFKSINDRYGHPIGDEALRRISLAIRKIIRVEDVPGRIGGEEFCLLLPGTLADKAMLLAERLRHYLAGMRIETATGESFAVTFSAGIAQWRQDMDGGTLMRLADQALYLAKAAGRDRILKSTDIPEDRPETTESA
jgi:diguanylate cyclase (GGDEF)-like protein